jgi:lipopolysaccharide export system permease protein
MKTFARYIFRQAFGATALILLSLTGVVWVAVALRQLNVVTSQGQDALMFIKMTTLALPNLMALIAPVALLIATIHTLNRLNSDSELIVLTASGATVWTIAKPLLLLGFLMSAVLSLVNHFVMPWSLRELRDAIIQVRTDLIAQVVQPGRFSVPESGLTFHIRERTFEGLLQGMLVHDARDPAQITTYLAERAQIVKQGGTAFLIMEDGHILRRSTPNAPADIVRFQSYAVDLERFEKKDDTAELKPRERYFGELAYPAADDPDFLRQPGHFRAELHERFSNPLYPLVFVLIALACVGQAQSTRQNRVEPVIAGFVFATLVRLTGFAANNLVVLNARWTFLLYAIPLGSILLAIVAIRLNARPRPGPSLADRVSMAIGDLFARLPWRREQPPLVPATGRAS